MFNLLVHTFFNDRDYIRALLIGSFCIIIKKVQIGEIMLQDFFLLLLFLSFDKQAHLIAKGILVHLFHRYHVKIT